MTSTLVATPGASRHKDHHGGWRDLTPAILLLLLSLLAIGGGIALPDEDALQVAAVFAPGSDANDVAAAVSAAGASFVRPGAFQNIVVVELNGNKRYSDLYNHGALLVLDAIAAGGCAISQSRYTPDV